jgi:uncharacterized membrane protein
MAAMRYQLLLLTAFLLLQSAPALADPFCDKAEMKADGDINLVPMTKNGVRGIRACAYVAATTEETYAALTDYPSFPRWIDKVEKIDAKWDDAQVAMVTYTLGTMFGSYHYTLRRVHQKDKRVEWSRASGDLKVIDGTYDFTPIPGQKASYLIMETYLDPGVKMPGFIENYFREKGSRRLMNDIREEVARRQKAKH